MLAGYMRVSFLTRTSALIESAMVDVFFGVRSKLPASSLGFVPSNFVGALEFLELRIDG